MFFRSHSKTLLLCASLLWTGAGAAIAPQAIAASQSVRDVQQQILILIKAKRYDEALALADAFQPEHKNHEARVAFVAAMIAKAKGQNRDAAKAFRTVLSQQPELVPARQGLAQALMLDGDYEAAQYQFDVLASSTTDPHLRRLYNSYSSKISEKRPWSLSGYVTVAPSTNVNKGSKHDFAVIGGNNWAIGKDNRKSSGIGLAAGGDVGYNWFLGEGFSLNAAAGVDGRFYKNHDDDVVKLSGSVKPTYTAQDRSFRIGIGPYAEAMYSSYDLSVLRYGGIADVLVRGDAGLVFSGSLSVLYQDYETADYRNGLKTSLNARVIKTIDATSSIGVMGGLVVENTDRDNLDHVDYLASVTLSKEWSGGWMTGLEPTLAYHDYDGLIFGKNEQRKDWAYGASLRLSNRNFSAYGFMPVLNYSYTNQISNDEFSEFDSHDFSITLSRDF